MCLKKQTKGVLFRFYFWADSLLINLGEPENLLPLFLHIIIEAANLSLSITRSRLSISLLILRLHVLLLIHRRLRVLLLIRRRRLSVFLLIRRRRVLFLIHHHFRVSLLIRPRRLRVLLLNFFVVYVHNPTISVLFLNEIENRTTSMLFW